MTQAGLKTFGLGLGLIVEKAYHYTAPENTPARYVVWAELSGEHLAADNRESEGKFEIAVDYFTTKEFDTTIDDISDFLDGFGSWRIESVQYEEQTGYIHYEWRLDYA